LRTNELSAKRTTEKGKEAFDRDGLSGVPRGCK
jgi:hypothetical protein